MVVIPLLITILSISGFVVFYNGVQHISLHSVYGIGGNTSVIIEPNCYSTFWTKEVTISNIKQYDAGYNPIIVTLYKTRKKNLHYRKKQPKEVKLYFNIPGLHINLPVNILYGHVPIYSSGNGTLTYTFSFRADVNFTICPLELRMFNNYQEFNQFINQYSDVNGPITSSNCTLNSVNSTLQKHVINFHLHSNTFYYFAVGLTKGLYVNITITGQLEEFEVSNLTPEKCFLSSAVDTSSCTIPIAHSSVSYTKDYICLLAHSTDKHIGNFTVDVTPAIWNIGSVSSLSFSIATCLITASIIIAIIFYVVWHIKKESAVVTRYSDLLNDD